MTSGSSEEALAGESPKALIQYKLGTDPEKEYDAITRLALYICNVRSAFITFFSGNKQWIKSSVGSEVPGEIAQILCHYTVSSEKIFEVPDTHLDPRFASHTSVAGEPHFSFYAGVPLFTPDGYCIGALCVADPNPGELTPEQRDALKTLSEEIVSRLELNSKSKQLEETLRKYQDANTMFHSSAEIHCILDENSIILKANRALEKILGLKIYDCVGKPIWEFLPPEEHYKFSDLINQGLKSGRGFFELETSVITKSKTTRWIGWTIAIHNRKWYANGRDITAQKKTQEDLEQLSLVASKTNNGVVISDSHQVIWVNEAFREITGFTLEDFKGKRLGDLLKGNETDESVILNARELTRKKKSFTVDLLAYRKDGTPIWLSIMNSVILNDEGEIEREIELVTDITDRKKVELELEVLSLVASKSSSGVIIRNQDLDIMWVNPAIEQMLGYSSADLVGKHLMPLLQGEHTDLQVVQKIDQAVAENRPFNLEVQCYKKDRSPIWLYISHTPIINSEGRLERAVEVMVDITEKKIAEQELIKTREEAVQLGKAKETLLSVMSHEIRTPLNAVVGMTHLLIDDNPTPAQLENLNILKFSAENLMALINDILDFTKIETGNLVLEKIDVNLKELVAYTLSTFQFKAVEQGIAIKSEIDYRIPDLVKGDHTRLYQILINLVGNAVKFTSKGEVKVKLELVGETSRTVDVRFEVSDTGIGIPEEKIESIFDAFTQACSDTTRKFGGTGLGLSITKSLIRLFNADIKVDSKEGQGSTFSFTISFERIVELSSSIPAPTKREQLPASILVVDDNQINRILARKVLTKWGVQVDYAENGEIAVEKVRTKKYDLVLMDIHMQGMNGLEATALIRSFEGKYFKHLPIIALTASLLSNDLGKIQQAGINDFVLKPFTPDTLFEKIKLYLNKGVRA
ncbi:MAG TPA: PAS domain-containing protein [Sphingobacteriaceae bacterium]